MHAWKPIRGSIDSFCSVSLWSATAQKSAWSVDRPRPAIRNERPPAERSGGGGCGEARRGGTTTMMRRNRRNREPTVGRRPSLIIGGQSVRGDTPRAFFSSLCPVHGKLIRGNAGEGRSTRSRSCVSASLPRARSLRGSD